MKYKNNLLVISIIFFSICFLISVRLISNSLDSITRNQQIEMNYKDLPRNSQLINEVDLQMYLGLTESELTSFINQYKTVYRENKIKWNIIDDKIHFLYLLTIND
ncbi:hypothetical protein [Bacillus sp. AFS088145]|uniref:hypothetical protein n=1 Tax=Bacillus sp. AFS088145 TaxID=2033514 RepID=UPI000BF2C533|nr:hypothetical protein [Bacillus sp. AFS088145]PFH86977.1 hypothetical protein COI44_11450 [Bacillus sp. AFS088145]